jgi:hypothetical protein
MAPEVPSQSWRVYCSSPTIFIGRESALGEMWRLLATTRLLTLTGPRPLPDPNLSSSTDS